MKIFRVAEEKIAPSWAFEEKAFEELQEKNKEALKEVNCCCCCHSLCIFYLWYYNNLQAVYISTINMNIN